MSKKSKALVAVLQKGNRTLIVTAPTKRQLKKYKERAWNVKVDDKENNAVAVAALMNQLLETVGGGNVADQTNH